MIQIKENSIKGLSDLFKTQASIAVIMHTSPDGDTVGSALALSMALNKAGNRSVCISPDEIPDFLTWLPGIDNTLIFSKEAEKVKKVMKNSDILVSVDFNSPKRASVLEKLITDHPGKKIVIDHHPDSDRYADITISYIDVSSTAELLFHILIQLGWKKYIDIDIAECLYAGIMTDTGSFNFATNNPSTFAVVSELIKMGVDQEKLHSRIYHNYSSDRQRLLGYCLNKKLVHYPEFNTALISISMKELKEYNYSVGDTEGFVNMPLQIKNVIFSALFTEREKEIKISFRSKGNFSANDFARLHFNGGGHKNAAGGHEYVLNLEQTVAKFTALLNKYRNELDYKI